jgi:hypothetical protein
LISIAFSRFSFDSSSLAARVLVAVRAREPGNDFIVLVGGLAPEGDISFSWSILCEQLVSN